MEDNTINLDEWTPLKWAAEQAGLTVPGIAYAIEAGHLDAIWLWETLQVVNVASLNQYIENRKVGIVGPGRKPK